MYTEAKKWYNDEINNIIQNSFLNNKISWRILKQYNQTHKNDIPSLNHNEEIVINPSEKTQILHKTLANSLPPKLEAKHIHFHEKINNKIRTLNISNVQINEIQY